MPPSLHALPLFLIWQVGLVCIIGSLMLLVRLGPYKRDGDDVLAISCQVDAAPHHIA